MSTEREMLEAAARAVGWGHAKYADRNRLVVAGELWVNEDIGFWNPRLSSQDSFELAAALRISVEHNPNEETRPWVCASVDGGPMRLFIEDVPDESQRADRMRLAILRCAAAQALAMGAETAENGSKTAGNGVDAGFHRGRGVAPKEQA